MRIDARGLKCPWPAIRLGRALRAGTAPVEILADDANAEGELRALAVAHGVSFCVAETAVYRIGQ